VVEGDLVDFWRLILEVKIKINWIFWFFWFFSQNIRNIQEK
jgi:hypothetical protein